MVTTRAGTPASTPTASPTPTPTKKHKKASKPSSSSLAKMATEEPKANGHSSAIPASLTTTASSSAKRVTRSEAHKLAIATGRFPTESKDVLAPKSEHYEFGGPLGCLFVSVAVPLTSWGLFYFCNEQTGCAVPPENWRASLQLMITGVVQSCFDWKAWVIYFGWYAFSILAWAVLPGPWIEGTELRTGVKLKYKINAFSTLVVSLLITTVLIAFMGPQNFTVLYDHWEGLVTASLFNSMVQAIYCYAVSFQEGRLLAKAANTGNFIHDWFLGREMNPRIGTFDIKYFNELRPGLIFWVLLDISCACAQYAREGQITDSMLLVLLFHGAYVIDGCWNEPAILTTMDITTDGFGFMLSVGDLTWVPFTYTLQARFLVFQPVYLGIAGTLAIFAFNGLGYYIFRSANGEKNQFRSGHNPKNLQYMTTSSGRKLLTSGWWGRSRHPNYMGDLIMGLAWSLPCGFSTPIPYFYIIYFTILLVHRQIRDDDACRLKYGEDWDRYCEKVPWKIFPLVY